MAWTDKMVEDLRRMWKEGLTTGEIGRRLGVSKNSIVGKVHRLGLSGRPSPIKRKGSDAAASAKANKPTAAKIKSSFDDKESSLAGAKNQNNDTAKESAAEKKAAPEVKTAPVFEKKSFPLSKEGNFVSNFSFKIDYKQEDLKSGVTKLINLDNHTCRWPIGDPKDENFHFCGKKVRMGQTYCEEHAAIAYVKATAKK